MKIDWDGRSYDFDVFSVRLSQAEQIIAYTGHKTLGDWERCLTAPEDPGNPRSVVAAWWLMMAQAGEDVKLADADPPYLRFLVAYAEAVAAEVAAAAQAAEADPTKPGAASVAASPVPAAETG